MIELDPKTMSRDAIYKIMSGAVVPRPVAWITTRSETGLVNAAPFSAFTILSQDPPLILFQAESGVREKDTIANIRANEHFVVNIPTMALLDEMHECSIELPSEVSEPELLGIELAESRLVAPPRVAASPVAFECRLHHMFDVGNEPHTVVIGEIVWFRIAEAVYVGGKIDQERLDPVARIGGPYYARLGEVVRRPAPTGQGSERLRP